MDITSGLRLANTSSDVATFSERNAATSEDPAGPANSLGTLLNNVEHFRHHRSDDEKLSPEKREAALVQIMGARPAQILTAFTATLQDELELGSPDPSRFCAASGTCA